MLLSRLQCSIHNLPLFVHLHVQAGREGAVVLNNFVQRKKKEFSDAPFCCVLTKFRDTHIPEPCLFMYCIN